MGKLKRANKNRENETKCGRDAQQMRTQTKQWEIDSERRQNRRTIVTIRKQQTMLQHMMLICCTE
jgi:hypothetical protein